jgi:hypothetical protein
VREEYKDSGVYPFAVAEVQVTKKHIPTFSYGNRVRIAKIHDDHNEFLYKIITVAGWARSVRSGKGFCFITLTDGSS